MRPVRALAAFALAAFGLNVQQPAFAQDSIRIGTVYPLTGPLAGQGRPARDAIKLAFDEEKNVVAGRKIELLFEDSAGRPDTGLTKFKALVERDKVHLLLSELVSAIGAAVAPYVTEQKIPWVSNVSLSALTRQLKSPYIFRFVPSTYQFSTAAAEVTKKMGWKKVYLMGWNAPPGHEAHDALKKAFGAENVEAQFSNVGTSDYAPYISKMDPSKADGVFAAMWGADSARIVQQYVEYGLNKKMPFFGIASFTSEEILGNMPPESVGVHSAFTYCGTLDTPENKAFVAGYKAANNNALPGSYQYMSYMAAKMVIQALKDINGKVEDRQAFLDALSKVQVKGPMGMASFDSNRGMIGDFYALQVEKGADGKLFNKCGDRIAQVKDPYDLFP